MGGLALRMILQPSPARAVRQAVRLCKDASLWPALGGCWEAWRSTLNPECAGGCQDVGVLGGRQDISLQKRALHMLTG